MLIERWLEEAWEKDHAKGVWHGITSTGGYCPKCLIDGSYLRAASEARRVAEER